MCRQGKQLGRGRAFFQLEPRLERVQRDVQGLGQIRDRGRAPIVHVEQHRESPLLNAEQGGKLCALPPLFRQH